MEGVPGSSSLISASCGSVLSSSSTVALSSSLPTTVQAVLLTQNGVWSDTPNIAVAVQVRDASFNVQTSSSSVVVSVVPVSFAGSAVTGSCSSSSTTGQCTITVVLPASWFSTGNNETIAIGYKLSSSSGNSTFLANLPLFTNIAFPIGAGAFLSLPSRDLFLTNTFTGTVQVNAGTYSVNTFRFTFTTVATQLQINSITVNSAVWAASILSVNSTQYVVTASPASPLTRPVLSPGLETLCQVSFTVLSTATTDSFATIGFSVVDLFDAKGVAVYPVTPTSGTFVDRTGVSSIVGRVYVASTRVVGILPYVAQAELVNDAVLLSLIHI